MINRVYQYSLVLLLLSSQFLVDSLPHSNRNRRSIVDDITISDETATEEPIFEILSNNLTEMFVSDETDNITTTMSYMEVEKDLVTNEIMSIEVNSLDFDSNAIGNYSYNDTRLFNEEVDIIILNETSANTESIKMNNFTNLDTVSETNELEVDYATIDSIKETDLFKMSEKEESSSEYSLNPTTLEIELEQSSTKNPASESNHSKKAEETTTKQIENSITDSIITESEDKDSVSVEENDEKNDEEEKEEDDENKTVEDVDVDVDDGDDDDDNDDDDDDDNEIKEADDEVSDDTYENNVFKSHTDTNKTLIVQPKFNQTIKHIQKEIRMYADCPDVSCEFGYQTDLNGKTLCKCYNPCSENKCGSKICVIKMINKKYQGICIDPKKIDRPIKCYLKVEKGRCRNYVSRFYYNSFYQECAHFVFRGCQGNANNFNTWSECNTECNVCSQPPDSGPCRSYNIRYYYDSSSKKCVPFNYGGCRGNKNNFISKKLCEDTC